MSAGCVPVSIVFCVMYWKRFAMKRAMLCRHHAYLHALARQLVMQLVAVLFTAMYEY